MMKFFLFPLSLSLAILLEAKPRTAATTPSIRGGEQEAAVRSEEGEGELHRSSTRFLSEGRRLLPNEGIFRTLIIRVTDSEGNEPVTDARRESDVWFGTHNLFFADNLNSLASLYEQCSGGKLSFVPATGNNVVDGVFELTVDQNLRGMQVGQAGGIVRDKFNMMAGNLGIDFDAYSIILPDGVSGSGGLARQGGAHQYYAGGADRSLELVMHEFGHNLGFHHSGLPNEGDYDDNSCMMGCCAGAQQMCFNAAKSWYTGWYTGAGKEGYEDLSHFDTPGQWWKGKLVGIDDYLNDVFDENKHRVVAKTAGGLFMMFNRAKGINAGVKAYGNQVVLVQQWSKGGKSDVLATLDEETTSFTFSSDFYDFDVVVKLCEITYSPIITGPQIVGGTASQSSTSHGAEAHRAIDGNLDATWAGNGVTHTEGGDINPWWKLDLDKEEEVQHIRIYNRGDCCGSRLNNAFIDLFDGNGDLVFSRNMGAAEAVKEVFLGDVYNVKEVIIRLHGDRILSLAEVQLFAPSTNPQARQPDYADVIAYISNPSQDPNLITCDTTFAPSKSLVPSSKPTISIQPTNYVAIPRDVILVRDAMPCIFQHNPANHPDRFKCMIEPTTLSNEPGGYGNDNVVLSGKDDCFLTVQPVTWAYGGNAFIFESTEDLDAINACFASGVHITEHGTIAAPSITPSIIPTTVSPSESPTKAPTYTPTDIPTNTPSVNPTINPTTAPTLSPTVTQSEVPTESVSIAPSSGSPQCSSDSDCDDFDECTSNMCSGIYTNTCHYVAGACSGTGQVCSDKQCVVPVILLRDSSPCIHQHNPSNHPDRFKCMLQPTAVSNKPGTYGNEEVALRGSGGCLLSIQPVTWAWEGSAFIFESSASLDIINACFAPGTLVSKSLPTPAPSIAPSRVIIPKDVVLRRDDSPCIFQHNPANHPDRFKCMIQPTAVSNEPGTYGNDSTALRGKDGCVVMVQPVTWAWEGNAFIFESTENISTINACFGQGTLITESTA